MIDVIQTLKNLNKEFPRFQLETLLKIVECIREKSEWYYPTTIYTNQNRTWWTNDHVTCDSPYREYEPDAFIYTTTTKNHAADKTSSNQNITSEGEEASDFNTLEDWLSYQRKGTALSATYEPKK